MKKFYDKLLLLLTFLALLAGAAFYVLKSNAAEDRGPDTVPQPAGNPYQPVAIPDPATREATWPEPEPQSSGPNWLYDVFTPPKIYLDAEGNFTAEPPKPPEPPEPFGIYLAKLERKPYRIQLEGYSGASDDSKETVAFLFDVQRQLKVFIREGESDAEAEIELRDFTVDRRIDAEEGRVDITATATIFDQRRGKELKLNIEEDLFESEVSVVFLSEEDPDVEIELSVEPEDPTTSFATPAGEFILKEISLEDSTATVEKRPTEGEEANKTKTRVLSPVMDNQPTQPTQPSQSDSSEETIGDGDGNEEATPEFFF